MDSPSWSNLVSFGLGAVASQIVRVAAENARTERAMKAIRFGVAPAPIVDPQTGREFLHVTVDFKPGWFARHSLRCRVWISADGGEFSPAHVDGLAIRGGQESYEDTYFDLERGLPARTIPVVLRSPEMALPLLYDRPLFRGETKPLAPGSHRLVLKISSSGVATEGRFDLDIPVDRAEPMTLTIAGSSRASDGR